MSNKLNKLFNYGNIVHQVQLLDKKKVFIALHY
jgi:hypothetical protein